MLLVVQHTIFLFSCFNISNLIAEKLRMRSSVVTMQHHPDLTEGHQVPYPHSMQFKLVEEKFKNLVTRSDETGLSGTAEVDADTAGAIEAGMIDGRFDRQAPGESSAMAAQPLADEPKPQTEIAEAQAKAELEKLAKVELEKVLTSIKNGSKAHAEFDRKKREFQAVLMKSKANENTSGTKYERDLQALVDAGTPLDTEYLGFECKHKAGEMLSQETRDRIAEICKELYVITKEGQKKSNNLNMWLRD
jgi:hypothetical protein